METSSTDDVLCGASGSCLVHELASHSGFSHAFVAHVRSAFHTHGDAARGRMPGLHFNFEAQLVTWDYGTAESRLLNAGEYHQLAAAIFHFGEQQRAARLGD